MASAEGQTYALVITGPEGMRVDDLAGALLDSGAKSLTSSFQLAITSLMAVAVCWSARYCCEL